MEQQIKPNTRYTWQPDEKFEITGQQLSTLNNFMIMYLQENADNVQKALNFLEAHKAVTETLNKGIEDGKLKEEIQEGLPMQVTETATGIPPQEKH